MGSPWSPNIPERQPVVEVSTDAAPNPLAGRSQLGRAPGGNTAPAWTDSLERLTGKASYPGFRRGERMAAKLV
jgi:hypothetical protein